MLGTSSENSSSRIVAVGLAAVTIAVWTQSVSDPVNVPKLFLLGGFAFAAFGASSRAINISILKIHRIPLLAVACFSVAAVSTLFASKAPFSQSLYGVYGRNNGFILYLLLVFFFISALLIKTQTYLNRVLVALLAAGITNIAYALWVLAFGDFISWTNPYGNLLGTFGNPNFIGSFLGMFSALLFSFLLSPNSTKNLRVGSLLLLPLAFLGIVQSNAVQGKVLFFVGFNIAAYYWVRHHFKNVLVSFSYLAISAIGLLVALLGTLQKGPLSVLLYKESISLRGEYWYAGWKTGLSNPIFGAGFDSLGDWYRRSRRESSLTLPGVDTVINTAHNVFMDMFAFGGWPLLISYSLIVIVVLVSIFRFTINNREFDPVFVSLTGVWLCYQLQSTISINQVGLAVWGWAFGGAIIAYEVNASKKFLSASQPDNLKNKTNKRSNPISSTAVFSPGLIAMLATVVGLIITVPPLSADTKWRSAQISQSAELLEESLKSSYMNPSSSFQFNNVVGVFETNGLTELAHTYGLKAVAFNPDSYDSWRNLYQLSKSSDSERALAVENMKRLDPLNPNIGVMNR